MNAPHKSVQSTQLLHSHPGFRQDERGNCPIREVLDLVGDTWSILVIINLQAAPRRFNALKRAIEGISQRMLTVTLRSLEREGLVRRTVRPTTPPEVEYALTDIGHSIAVPIAGLAGWAEQNRDLLRAARTAFDAAQKAS